MIAASQMEEHKAAGGGYVNPTAIFLDIVYDAVKSRELISDHVKFSDVIALANALAEKAVRSWADEMQVFNIDDNGLIEIAGDSRGPPLPKWTAAWKEWEVEFNRGCGSPLQSVAE